jgi:hypothetical protein
MLGRNSLKGFNKGVKFFCHTFGKNFLWLLCGVQSPKEKNGTSRREGSLCSVQVTWLRPNNQQ